MLKKEHLCSPTQGWTDNVAFGPMDWPEGPLHQTATAVHLFICIVDTGMPNHIS